MNKEEVKELVNTLSKKFKRKEINIIFTGAIEFTIKMKNIRFFVTRDIIIIVNEDDTEIRIEPFYIDDIDYTNNVIKLDMERLLFDTNWKLNNRKWIKIEKIRIKELRNIISTFNDKEVIIHTSEIITMTLHIQKLKIFFLNDELVIEENNIEKLRIAINWVANFYTNDDKTVVKLEFDETGEVIIQII